MLCVIAKLDDAATENLVLIQKTVFPGNGASKALYGHITLATYTGDSEISFIQSCKKLLERISPFCFKYEKIEVLDETSIIVATPETSDLLDFLHQSITKEYNDTLDKWTKKDFWYPHTTLLYSPQSNLHDICLKMEENFVPFIASISRIEFSRVSENAYEIIDFIDLFPR